MINLPIIGKEIFIRFWMPFFFRSNTINIHPYKKAITPGGTSYRNRIGLYRRSIADNLLIIRLNYTLNQYNYINILMVLIQISGS